MLFAPQKNLKLKPNKFFISNDIESGGSVLKVEKVKNEKLIFLQLTGKRKAFEK